MQPYNLKTLIFDYIYILTFRVVMLDYFVKKYADSHSQKSKNSQEIYANMPICRPPAPISEYCFEFSHSYILYEGSYFSRGMFRSELYFVVNDGYVGSIWQIPI